MRGGPAGGWVGRQAGGWGTAGQDCRWHCLPAEVVSSRCSCLAPSSHSCLTAALPRLPALLLLQSLAAVPFGSIVIVLLIWMFISFPLCLFGTVVGRNWAGAPDHPCRWGCRQWGGE